jgi:hypothetical protein
MTKRLHYTIHSVGIIGRCCLNEDCDGHAHPLGQAGSADGGGSNDPSGNTALTAANLPFELLFVLPGVQRRV